MSENRQLILPITGMTCANCVATVERSLKKVEGVKYASVNLSSERATVEFDPSLAGMDDLVGRVRRLHMAGGDWHCAPGVPVSIMASGITAPKWD